MKRKIYKKKNPTEEQEQTALIKYVKLKYPKALFTVDLGGLNLNKAQRRIHSQRAKRGHPDLMFQEWFGDTWCGLAIELKRKDVKVVYANGDFKYKDEHLVEQLEYLNDLKNRSWFACFCSGFDDAKKVIDWYMSGDLTGFQKINNVIYPKVDITKFVK